MKFKCPKCGRDELEKVYFGVNQTVPIKLFDESDPEEDWDDTDENYDGCDQSIQCRNCGWELPITSLEDLVDYLTDPDWENKRAPWGIDSYGRPYTEEDARSSYDDDRLHAIREGD